MAASATAELNITLSGIRREPQSQLRAATPDGRGLPPAQTVERRPQSTSESRTLPRASTGGRELPWLSRLPRSHVTQDDAEELAHEFSATRHTASAAELLLSSAPLRRPVTRGLPERWLRGTKRAATPSPASTVEGSRKKERRSNPASPRSTGTPRRLPTTVQSRDLAILCRLAAVQSDHPLARSQAQLRHTLPMRHVDLRWVYDPARRPRVDARGGNSPTAHTPRSTSTSTSNARWCTVTDVLSAENQEALRDSYLLTSTRSTVRSGGGSRDQSAGGVLTTLNSPRSVLALFRRGIDPAQLQPVDSEALRKQLSIEGLDKRNAEARMAFLLHQREVAAEEAVSEYERLCAVLDRETVLQFIDVFIDGACDYARLPELTSPQKPQASSATADGGEEQRYGVAMPTDDRVTEALQNIRARNAKEQAMVKSRVAAELEGRARLAAMQEERAAEALQVTQRREDAARLRRQQLAEEHALRSLLAEERERERRVAREEAMAKLEQERKARDAAFDAIERAAAEARAERKQARAARVNEKRAKRERRLEAATQEARRQEEERAQRVAAADAQREAIMRQRREERKRAQLESERRTEAQRERRAAVAERGRALLEEKRSVAEQRQAEADKSLAEFRRVQGVQRQVRQVQELHRALRREELVTDAEEKAAAALAAREAQAAAQRRQFTVFRAEIAGRKAATAEAAREAKLGKRDAVMKNARRHEFERLQMEDALEAKAASAAMLDKSRRDVTAEATAARSRLAVERRDRLDMAAQLAVEAERKTYFKLFSAGRGTSHSPQKRSPRDRGAEVGGAEGDAPGPSPAPLQAPEEQAL